MNSMKSFRYQKIWLIITFISLVSCKKQADISPNQTILKNENAFFYREKVSPSANEKDLVDTIINFCKKGDSTAHFSNKIIAKYGYPQWDLALPISNANGLKSLFIPVVDTGNRVQLIIFAYQDSRKHVIFKFIDRNTEQTQLPKASGDSRIFCKESLTGIFDALDKSVAAARIPKNSSMENIKSNGTYVESLCWLISWHYDDGEVGVLNPQCSYQIIITPDNAGRKPGLANGLIGVYEDVQVGDGGGGGVVDPNPCANAEQEALKQLERQFNEYIEDKTPNNYPIYATQIDLKPYHEIINWTIVEGSINHWKVTARTIVDLTYDNFPASFDRTLSLQSLGSQYEGTNNLIMSTWTPLTPVIRIFNNHSRYPSGNVTESGTLRHRMKGDIKVVTFCGEFSFSPGFEDTRTHSNTLTVTTQ